MRALPSPALNDACTAPAGMTAASPGCSRRLSCSSHCSSSPSTTRITSSCSGCTLEVVALAGIDGDVVHHEALGAGGRRAADRRDRPPLQALRRLGAADDELTSHRSSPVTGIALNRFMFSVIA